MDSKVFKKSLSTKNLSEKDWLKVHHKTLGSSDIGTVMGLNPYKSALELFHYKIADEPRDSQRESAFHGKNLEAYVAKIWQHYDPEEPSFYNTMLNFQEKRIIRRCRKVNAFIYHPELPFFHTSPDRYIYCPQRGKGLLEIKTMSSYVSKLYISGLPPAYTVQLQQQLLVTGLEWGEVAILKDGNTFEVIPFERNEEIIAEIIEKGKAFFHRVEIIRKAKELGFEGEKLQKLIDKYEPAPDNTLAYAEYMKETYRPDKQLPARKAEPEHIRWAIKYEEACEEEEKAQSKKTLYSNLLKNQMRDQYQEIDLGQMGRVLWKMDSAGKKRTFKVNLKKKQYEQYKEDQRAAEVA